jgi:hypothetical protein
MTRPTRYLLLMVLCMIAVIALGVVLTPQLSAAYSHNPALNGGIFIVFLIGVVFIFWQVLRLKREILWIERFRSGDPTLSTDRGPRLLAPMAAMLRDRKGRFSLSAASLRSLLDGISSRLDESHDISRYLIGLMVFLGLLGTFWGLLQTIEGVAGTLSTISVAGDANQLFDQLKSGLQAPLAGHGLQLVAARPRGIAGAGLPRTAGEPGP